MTNTSNSKRRRRPPCPTEVCERAIWMVRENEAEHGSRWKAVNSVAEKIGCSGETLRNWVRQAERDAGQRRTRNGRRILDVIESQP